MVLQRPVQKTLAPDYNDFVDESEEMNLETMERKLKSALYGSSKDFMADINRIVRNATAYNTPGHGRYGGPGKFTWNCSGCLRWLGPRCIHPLQQQRLWRVQKSILL